MKCGKFNLPTRVKYIVHIHLAMSKRDLAAVVAASLHFANRRENAFTKHRCDPTYPDLRFVPVFLSAFFVANMLRICNPKACIDGQHSADRLRPTTPSLRPTLRNRWSP